MLTSRLRGRSLRSEFPLPTRHRIFLADILSPRNNLQVALDLYKKAETYVPDNVKLKERSVTPPTFLQFLC